MRYLFDALDGIDELSDQFNGITTDFDYLDLLMPQLLADLPKTIGSVKSIRNFMLSTHTSMAGIQRRIQEGAGSTMMGNYVDEAKNDDSFYLPPEVFQNHDFIRGLKMFVSPDGQAVRFIITQSGYP